MDFTQNLIIFRHLIILPSITPTLNPPTVLEIPFSYLIENPIIIPFVYRHFVDRLTTVYHSCPWVLNNRWMNLYQTFTPRLRSRWFRKIKYLWHANVQGFWSKTSFFKRFTLTFLCILRIQRIYFNRDFRIWRDLLIQSVLDPILSLVEWCLSVCIHCYGQTISSLLPTVFDTNSFFKILFIR